MPTNIFTDIERTGTVYTQHCELKTFSLIIIGSKSMPGYLPTIASRVKMTLPSLPLSRNERPNVGGVSIRSRNGAPSRKGCKVNGEMTKASNQCWLGQLKVSRLAELGQASEASHHQLPPAEGSPAQKGKKMHPILGNPSRNYGNPVSRIVGTCVKRLTVSLTNN